MVSVFENRCGAVCFAMETLEVRKRLMERGTVILWHGFTSGPLRFKIADVDEFYDMIQIKSLGDGSQTWRSLEEMERFFEGNRESMYWTFLHIVPLREKHNDN